MHNIFKDDSYITSAHCTFVYAQIIVEYIRVFKKDNSLARNYHAHKLLNTIFEGS